MNTEAICIHREKLSKVKYLNRAAKFTRNKVGSVHMRCSRERKESRLHSPPRLTAYLVSVKSKWFKWLMSHKWVKCFCLSMCSQQSSSRWPWPCRPTRCGVITGLRFVLALHSKAIPLPAIPVHYKVSILGNESILNASSSVTVIFFSPEYMAIQ